MKFTSLLLILPLIVAQVLGDKDIYKHEKEILDKVLNKDVYDKRIIPRQYNESTKSWHPVIVETNMFIRNIEEISTDKQEWTVQMTFRQKWTDPRLKYDQIGGQLPQYLSLVDTSRIWVPDVFFSNSRSTHSHMDFGVPNLLFRIYPDGKVLFSTRITSVLTCHMNLVNYPYDTQVCKIQFASYAYTTTDVVFLWKESDPVQVTKNLNLPEQLLNKYITSYCTSKTNTGEYSCMAVHMVFERAPVKYVFQWFVTTAIITFMSFASFWMAPTKCSRIKYLALVLGLLYAHIVVINMLCSPKTTYYTSKDWWFMWCSHFVIAAIIELGIVKLIDWRHHTTRFTSDQGIGDYCDSTALKSLHPKDSYKTWWENWRDSSFGRKIDFFCAIIFPLLYISYIIYFYIDIKNNSNEN